jgi:cell division protein ZapA
MTQVSVNLNGRSYRLRCGVGEEDRLVMLANEVKARFDKLIIDHGQVGDDRLLLMTSLLLVDELLDARAALETATGDQAAAEALALEASEQARSAELRLASRLADAAKPARKGAA